MSVIVAGRIMLPQRCPEHILIAKTCEWYLTWQNELFRYDWKPWDREITLHYLGDRKERSEGNMIMEEWSERCNFADFEDGGREPWTKNVGASTRWKSQGNRFFPGSYRKKCSPSESLILSQLYQCQTSNQRTVR